MFITEWYIVDRIYHNYYYIIMQMKIYFHLTILYEGYYSYTGDYPVTQITQLLMAGSTFTDG